MNAEMVGVGIAGIFIGWMALGAIWIGVELHKEQKART